MKTYKVTITGTTPLLMHSDNIDWADKMDDWKADPSKKKGSKAGDDRSPAWRWIGSLYHDGEHVAIPSDNLMRCCMEGGAMVPVPGGKNGKTFKSQSQSGMVVGEPFWKLTPSVRMTDIQALMDSETFGDQRELVVGLGFALFVKRAKIGTSKHIRVRPRFDQWSASGTINVWDEQISKTVLLDILTYGGRFKGLGDWRPGGKTPGAFGMFTASIQ